MSRLVDPVVEQIAEEFWTRASVPATAPWPRDLESALAGQFEIFVVLLPQLTYRRVREWLNRRGIATSTPPADQPAHGFLVARYGRGVIFLDGRDPPEERRFTLAHEVAHFLLDHWQPRGQVERQVGPAAIEVVDGWRAATVDELLAGWLRDAPVLVQQPLVGSSHEDGPTARIWRAETRADRLALELLAPARVVAEQLIASGSTARYGRCRSDAERLLTEHFRLPAEPARAYAIGLADSLTGGPSLLERLAIDLRSGVELRA